jgi:hypothetical protein
MKEVYLVSMENKNKAELALKQDELVNRGSITLKDASALGFEKSGFFIILDASEEALKKAALLLKDIAKKYVKKDKVLKKVEEEEEAAASGFGNIIGW